MTHEQTAGQVVVISGPSGSGKSTVLKRLFADCPLPLRFSVSATTRSPRPGERSGVDYHFLAPEEFAARRERGEFLECFEVYGKGYWYGTLHSEVRQGLASGAWMVLEVDVQGARAVRLAFPRAITLFLAPRSVDELAERLRNRGTESEAQLAARLAAAERELAEAREYRHQVINDSAERAADEICRILLRHRETCEHA